MVECRCFNSLCKYCRFGRAEASFKLALLSDQRKWYGASQ